MKRGLALAGALFLILGFQNCSQSALQGTDSLNDKILVVDSSLGSQVDETSTSKVTFVEVPNISQDSNGQNFSQKGSVEELTPYRLVVSLQSGSISLMDDKNQVLGKKCLSSLELSRLKDILSGASICTAQKSEADMCAQVYSPGYASLYADKERIPLGEKRDSCGSGKKDLCGEQAQEMQDYISALREHWVNMSCP